MICAVITLKFDCDIEMNRKRASDSFDEVDKYLKAYNFDTMSDFSLVGSGIIKLSAVKFFHTKDKMNGFVNKIKRSIKNNFKFIESAEIVVL